MPSILICGDTLRSPELRHEVTLGIGDAFLYLETDGRRAVLTNVLEVDRIAQHAPELERLLGEQLGRDELIAEGLSWTAIDRELPKMAGADVDAVPAIEKSQRAAVRQAIDEAFVSAFRLVMISAAVLALGAAIAGSLVR